MNKQDILHGISIVVLIWITIQQQVHALISEKAFSLVGIAFLALNAFAYYADFLVKGKELPVTPPLIPPQQ